MLRVRVLGASIIRRGKCYCSLTKCSVQSSSSSSSGTTITNMSISDNALSSKCEYVKALYGYGVAAAAATSSFSSVDCRLLQAATVALQNYLHFRRGVPLDDAVFISSNSPNYVGGMVQRLRDEYGDGSYDKHNYEQVRSRMESLMQREGVDEMEPFLESIGVTSGGRQEDVDMEMVMVATSGHLCGEHGLLRTAKVLESRGIPKRTFWALLKHNNQLLNYSLRDCLDVVGILLDFGLLPRNIGIAVTACPSLFKIDLEEEMRSTVEQVQRVGLDKTLIGQIILEAPTKVETLMKVNVEALLTAIQSVGLDSQETLEMVQQHPIILVGTSIVKLMQLVKYLKTILYLEDDEVACMIRQYPRILVLSLEKSVVSKVDYLKEIGLDRAHVKNIVVKTPQVLSFNLDTNLKPKVGFFDTIGLSKRSLGVVLAKYPELLNDIVSNDLRRKANFLLQQGVPNTRLADLFYTFPQFVGLRLEDVRRRLEYYNKELRMGREAMGHMIVAHPAVLTYDEEHARAAVDYLINNLGLDQIEVKELLKTRPMVLGKDVEELEAKARYFEGLGFVRGTHSFNEVLSYGVSVPDDFIDVRLNRLRELGVSEAQLKQLLELRMPLFYRDDARLLGTLEYLLKDMQMEMDYLLKFPQFFGYDLESRVRPRHRLIAFLKANNIVKRDYPAAYLHMSSDTFEGMFLDAHPQARYVYREGRDDQPVTVPLSPLQLQLPPLTRPTSRMRARASRAASRAAA